MSFENVAVPSTFLSILRAGAVCWLIIHIGTDKCLYIIITDYLKKLCVPTFKFEGWFWLKKLKLYNVGTYFHLLAQKHIFVLSHIFQVNMSRT